VSERFDRYNLAARLERFGDQLMTACENNEAIESRIDVCAQIGAVRRIVMTLKALRMEDRRGAEPDSPSPAARCESSRRVRSSSPGASAGSAVEAAGDPFIDDPCWTDAANE
jgi:hypothetical protein